MTVYRVAIVLHVLAALLWLGHMFFWSLFAGPVMKKISPPETAGRLREQSLRMGGLGWPSLAVLIATGAILLSRRGITPHYLLSDQLMDSSFGRYLALKLLLVVGMVGFQVVFAHRRAPRAIYLNMLAALIILGVSVFLAGG